MMIVNLVNKGESRKSNLVITYIAIGNPQRVKHGEKNVSKQLGVDH